MKNKYCSLHTHSSCSLLDAISHPEDLVKKAAKHDQPAMALTNHGNVHDSIEFYKAAKEVGIKPIIGCEFYLVDKIPNKDRDYTHLTILAQNQTGWENLNKLVTVSNRVGFYYRPRIDLSTIQEHSSGLICLSGCMSSRLSKHILNDETDKAMHWSLKLKGIFKKNFFLEVMDGGVPGEDKIRDASRMIAQKLRLETVATQDSHYIEKEDWEAHEVACALSSNAKLSEPTRDDGGKRKRFSTNEFWLKTAEEIAKSLTSREIQMSVEIANMCEDYLTLGQQRIPQYAPDSFEQLKALCASGIRQWNVDKPKYWDRLALELKDIKEANLADYFMVVYDIVQWIRKEGIPIGPGRGSAAGSLVAYLLEITEIDPVQYGLLWERFYNAGRAGSMPDIDTDVCLIRRGEVIDYIRNRFGADRVAHIMSLGKFQLKAAIKDSGRCLEIPLQEIEAATKNIPNKGLDNLTEAEKAIPEVAKLFSNHPKLKRVSNKLHGTAKHLTMHPSAIVVTDEDISKGCIPMTYNAKKKVMMTGVDMHGVEDLGNLKIDILGLKTVTLIGDVLDEIHGGH